MSFFKKLTRRRKAEKGHPLTPSTELLFNSDALAYGFYILGADPNSESTEPKLLYSYPNRKSAGTLLKFCFPNDTVNRISINDPQKYRQHLLTEPIVTDLQYFIIYCPFVEYAPYFFCAKYQANSFTMPSFAHKLGLKELFEQSPIDSLKQFDIIVAIRAASPYYDLYMGIIEWLLRCDTFLRQEITELVDSYINLKNYDDALKEVNKEIGWPQTGRDKVTALLQQTIRRTFHLTTKEVKIESVGLPIMSWTKPPYQRSDFSLSVFSLNPILSAFDINLFITFFEGLLLEKNIIVYSSSISLGSIIILAANLIVYPLRLCVDSITSLPDSERDLLKDDKPKVVGISTPLKPDEIPKNTIYISANENESTIQTTFEEEMPEFPRQDDLIVFFENGFWFEYDNQKTAACKGVVSTLHGVMKDFLLPLEDALEPNDKDDSFSFNKEKYLSFFMEESKPFVEQFLNTQMMNSYIAQLLQAAAED